MALHYSGLGPPSYGRMVELYPAVEKTLKLSNIKSGEKVIIYTDTKKNKDLVDCFFTALNNLGAEVALVMTTPRDDPNRDPLPVALEAMENVDTIIDLASIGWIYTKPYSKLLEKGIRILCNMSDPDTCIKMAPIEKTINRAKNGGKLIDQAKKIKVTSDSGTNLEVVKGNRPGMFQDSILEGPGSWDNFPAAQCACAPLENKANGKLVLNYGDVIATLKRRISEPVEITIKNGKIVKIEGGEEAVILEKWFKKHDDPNAYIISHIGFGCDHRAEIESMELMELESFGGNMMIAFGNNSGRFLGGKNVSKAHIDLILLETSFYLDGEKIIDKGEFYHPDLK
ncbi:MAG: hypothetical protein ACQEQD_08220 [Bacillota bacterium]